MLFIKIYSLHFSEPRIFVAKPLSSQCDSEYHPSCLAPLSDIVDSGFGCQSLSRISPVYLFDFSPFLALLDSYPYSFSLLIVVPPPPPPPLPPFFFVLFGVTLLLALVFSSLA